MTPYGIRNEAKRETRIRFERLLSIQGMLPGLPIKYVKIIKINYIFSRINFMLVKFSLVALIDRITIYM